VRLILILIFFYYYSYSYLVHARYKPEQHIPTTSDK
jgi:hypothetical protein